MQKSKTSSLREVSASSSKGETNARGSIPPGMRALPSPGPGPPRPSISVMRPRKLSNAPTYPVLRLPISFLGNKHSEYDFHHAARQLEEMDVWKTYLKDLAAWERVHGAPRFSELSSQEQTLVKIAIREARCSLGPLGSVDEFVGEWDTEFHPLHGLRGPTRSGLGAVWSGYRLHAPRARVIPGSNSKGIRARRSDGVNGTNTARKSISISSPTTRSLRKLCDVPTSSTASTASTASTLPNRFTPLSTSRGRSWTPDPEQGLPEGTLEQPVDVHDDVHSLRKLPAT